MQDMSGVTLYNLLTMVMFGCLHTKNANMLILMVPHPFGWHLIGVALPGVAADVIAGIGGAGIGADPHGITDIFPILCIIIMDIIMVDITITTITGNADVL